MVPRFFFLRVEPGVELALRPYSSAPYVPFSLSVEAPSLVSGSWVVSSTALVGSGTLAAGEGSGAGAVLVVTGGVETVGVGSGIAAAGLGGAVSVTVEAETTPSSDATGNNEGRPSTGRGETASLPSDAAGRSEGSFP